MKRHADSCGCTNRKSVCPDVPKIHPELKASGWRWDGTGDNGLWAVGAMGAGRHFCLMNGRSAWEIINNVSGEVIAHSIGYRVERIFSGDDLVISIYHSKRKK